MGPTEHDLPFDEEVGGDWAILVAAGVWHNISDIDDVPLKLYAIYGPPEHPHRTLDATVGTPAELNAETGSGPGIASLSGPGVTASFQYDALGRRKSKMVNGVTTDFLYDGSSAVQELSGGSVQANLLLGLGIDEVLQRTDPAGARSFLADGLGSTLALTDSGNILRIAR